MIDEKAKIEPVILVPKDYVQIVRCKDCKFKYCGDSMKKYGVPDDILWCYWLDTEPDDYCSFGERKEE